MNKNEDISTQTGSKGNVAFSAQQVASVPVGAMSASPQRHITAGTMTVDQLMQAAFYNGRTPRSTEYKAGTRMALAHRIERIDIVPPYEAGTAAADAFFAGLDEGKSIWRAAVAKIGGAA